MMARARAGRPVDVGGAHVAAANAAQIDPLELIGDKVAKRERSHTVADEERKQGVHDVSYKLQVTSSKLKGCESPYNVGH